MRNVAAIPAVALLAGCGAGLLLQIRTTSFTIGIAVVVVVALATAVWAWRTLRPRLLASAVSVVFVSGGALLAAEASYGATHTTLRAAFDTAAGDAFSIYAAVEGVLTRDASLSAAGASLGIDVDTIECETCVAARSGAPASSAPAHVSGGVLVTVAGSLAADRIRDWRAGRRVRVPLTLRRPTVYRDPDVADREAVLARQGIALVGTAKSGALVEVMARGSIVAEAAASMRQQVRDVVGRTVGPHSGRSAAIVTAIVIGDRAGLDADVQRSLQEAGTYHVIAISGGNIAILAGVLLVGFRVAGVLGRAAMIVAALGLVAYAYLVGGGASVDRATLMAVVYFGTRAWDHRTSPLNTLALVAALLVGTDPLTLADPAFVLTFGATLAILVVMPPVSRWRLPRATRGAGAVLAASMAAEVALAPVAALVFARVTVAGLALNFLAIPLMAVAQLAGMALVPVALISTIAAEAVGWVAHAGAAGLVWSAQLVRFVPAATWRVPPPHWAAVIVYYCAVASACGSRGRSLLAAITCASIAFVWIVAAPWRLATLRGDGRLHVTFIDVGQGDATAIRFPSGTMWLVDAGGLSSTSTFDVGDRVVAPVIRRAGAWRLDALVLTHGDPDHVGGSTSILREFRPREIWEGVPVPPYEPIAQLANEARARGLSWRSVRAGTELVIDGVRVAVRHPPDPDWERQRVRNDDSVVLELIAGEVSVVLTGDIGRPVEPVIARALAPAAIRVLKAPHHGSSGSSSDALVDGARPAVVIVSAGRGNRFGHPARDVIERYRAAGAEIFRTDQDGAIFLETDGTTVRMRTFNGRMLDLRRDEGDTKTTKTTKTTKATKATKTAKREEP